MITETTAVDAVLDVLREHATALHDGDDARLRALSTPDVVRADLAPPLVQPTLPPAESAAALHAWLGTFDGPVTIEHRDPVVHADGSVAFVHALTSMTATPAGSPEPFTLWMRSTYGLRRVDGSFAAAVGLTPEDA